tara:strand:- start:9341 stop:9505 length:165 start_codon:yes stop_codon:yes gene_type:complete
MKNSKDQKDTQQKQSLKPAAEKLHQEKVTHATKHRPLSFLRKSLEKGKQCLSQL